MTAQWINYTIEDPAMWVGGRKLLKRGRVSIDSFPMPWAQSSMLIPGSGKPAEHDSASAGDPDSGKAPGAL